MPQGAVTEKIIPCHLVAGPLGVGKSTAILDFLRSQQQSERIAVIVNDFGRTGLDASIFRAEANSGSGTPEIRNVPGGCLCCSSQLDLRTAMEEMLQNRDWSRVIIEPSGMALLGDLIPFLKLLCKDLNLVLRPVIGLIHPSRVKASHINALPFYRSLIDNADILVANRMDECSDEDREHFREWSHSLEPSKHKIIETTFGKLPVSAFSTGNPDNTAKEIGLNTASAAEPEDHHHHHHHHHEDHPHDHTRSSKHPGHSGGFTVKSPTLFSNQKLLSTLQQWTVKGIADSEILRFKALLPTAHGQSLFEIADQKVYHRKIGTPQPPCADWISTKPISEDTIIGELERCRDA